MASDDDISHLHLKVDYTTVLGASAALNQFQTSATGAAGATRQHGSETDRLSQQMKQMLDLQRQTNELLKQNIVAQRQAGDEIASNARKMSLLSGAVTVASAAYIGLSKNSTDAAAATARVGDQRTIQGVQQLSGSITGLGSALDAVRARQNSVADGFLKIADATSRMALSLVAPGAAQTVDLFGMRAMQQRVDQMQQQFSALLMQTSLRTNVSPQGVLQGINQGARVGLDEAQSIEMTRRMDDAIHGVGQRYEEARRTLQQYNITIKDSVAAQKQFLENLAKFAPGRERTEALQAVLGPGADPSLLLPSSINRLTPQGEQGRYDKAQQDRVAALDAEIARREEHIRSMETDPNRRTMFGTRDYNPRSFGPAGDFFAGLIPSAISGGAFAASGGNTPLVSPNAAGAGLYRYGQNLGQYGDPNSVNARTTISTNAAIGEADLAVDRGDITRMQWMTEQFHIAMGRIQNELNPLLGGAFGTVQIPGGGAGPAQPRAPATIGQLEEAEQIELMAGRSSPNALKARMDRAQRKMADLLEAEVVSKEQYDGVVKGLAEKYRRAVDPVSIAVENLETSNAILRLPAEDRAKASTLQETRRSLTLSGLPVDEGKLAGLGEAMDAQKFQEITNRLATTMADMEHQTAVLLQPLGDQGRFAAQQAAARAANPGALNPTLNPEQAAGFNKTFDQGLTAKFLGASRDTDNQIRDTEALAKAYEQGAGAVKALTTAQQAHNEALKQGYTAVEEAARSMQLLNKSVADSVEISAKEVAARKVELQTSEAKAAATGSGPGGVARAGIVSGIAGTYKPRIDEAQQAYDQAKTDEDLNTASRNLADLRKKQAEETADALKKAEVDRDAQRALQRREYQGLGSPGGGAGTSGASLGGSGGSKSAAAAVDDMMGMIGLHGASPQVRQFVMSNGVNMDPATAAWCAMFVNAALQHEGIKGSGSQMASSFKTWGVGVSPGDVMKGDVLVQGDQHVGQATGNVKGNMIEMVSGNTHRDSVGTGWYDASGLTIRRAGGGSGYTGGGGGGGAAGIVRGQYQEQAKSALEAMGYVNPSQADIDAKAQELAGTAAHSATAQGSLRARQDEERLKLEQQMPGAIAEGPQAVAKLNEQLQIEAQSRKALDEAIASGDQKRIAEVTAWLAELNKMSTGLREANNASEVARVEKQFSNQQAATGRSIAALNSGGTSAMELQESSEANRAALIAAGVPDDQAQARATEMAKATKSAEDYKKAVTDASAEISTTMKSGIGSIVDGLTNGIGKAHGFRMAMQQAGLEVSKLGLNMFVKKPLDTLADNVANGRGFNFNVGTSGLSTSDALGKAFSSGIGGLFGGKTEGAATGVGNGPAYRQNAAGGVANEIGNLGNLKSGNDNGTTGGIGGFFQGLFGGDKTPVGRFLGAGGDGGDGGTGGIYHSGGRVYHSGGDISDLASDEVPAILQTDEMVLSRAQTRAFDSMFPGGVSHMMKLAGDIQALRPGSVAPWGVGGYTGDALNSFRDQNITGGVYGDKLFGIGGVGGSDFYDSVRRMQGPGANDNSYHFGGRVRLFHDGGVSDDLDAMLDAADRRGSDAGWSSGSSLGGGTQSGVSPLVGKASQNPGNAMFAALVTGAEKAAGGLFGGAKKDDGTTGGIGGFFQGLFGGDKTAMGRLLGAGSGDLNAGDAFTDEYGKTWSRGAAYSGGIYHSGGRVARFHSGVSSDDMPSILARLNSAPVASPPPDVQTGASSPGGVVVNQNIYSPDANSFRATADQTAAAAQVAAQRAMRNQ